MAMPKCLFHSKVKKRRKGKRQKSSGMCISCNPLQGGREEPLFCVHSRWQAASPATVWREGGRVGGWVGGGEGEAELS